MKWLEEKFKNTKNVHIKGLTKELNNLYLNYLYENNNDNILIVTNSLYECNQIYSNLRTYNNNVLLFPMDDFLASVALAISPDLKIKRLETLDAINNGKKIVVTNLMGYLKFLPNLEKAKNFKLNLKVNQNITREEIISTLEEFGYTRDSLVTATGNYALRGFIIDVFPTFLDNPIRIEFFGSDIESIRYFDTDTQRSLEKIDSIDIKPFVEFTSVDNNSIYDYLKTPLVVFYDYNQIKTGYEMILEDITEYQISNELKDKKFMFDLNDIKIKDVIYLDTIDNITNEKQINYNSKEIENFRSDFKLLEEKVNKWLNEQKTVIFCLSLDNQIKEIKDIFNNIHIVKENIEENKVNILKKKINKGFIIDNLVVISEFDIEEISNETKQYKNVLKIGKRINSVNVLELGDYVVHRSHGIGIYNGIVTLNQRNLKKDFIQINYLGEDKVYIPVEKIDSIFKYTDKDGLKPKINKLDSTSWELQKRKAQSKIKDISQELMKLYAIRSNTKVEKYLDYPMEDLFALEFPYEETKDQSKAIFDVLNDLRSSIPMDRLLCGDVGFGKTEVAFRGMFKTVLNNRQVMYLCPTTILSKQQYTSCKNRFKSYPIEIALLNRFTTKKETDRILEDFSKGKIDILFGTHRLLSEDIIPKNLGLLVVDEEQRFGVTHKEKIKKLKNNVNVLTLSATPIPRTLKMAMSGLRDLSVIDTAPVNRYPVQTYVINEQELIVKDAIYKELSRKGQIFILYNKVADIEEFAGNIRKLIPEARVNFAHGQMTKHELDSIMEDFINNKFDILVCTTIIETGIDIPNANTLIIYDADHFGLSQLYQLRGRVGRSDRIAYAYLLYNKSKVLNDIAVKRLQAIKDFTELGSGYRIAMRDLSLRGAGDILGSEQAGFVDAIGLSLYMKMIEEEIKRLNGEEVIEEDTDNKALINVSTHISNDYASDEEVKIEIHQMINEINSKESLERVKNTLEDRFGKIGEEIEIYMYEEWFSKAAKSLNIKNVKQSERSIEFDIPEEYSNKVKGDKLFLKAYNISPHFQFRYVNKKIGITYMIKPNTKHFLYYIVPLLELIKEDIED